MGFPVASVAGAVTSLGGIFGDSKDPGRLETNARWYTQALTGNRAALDALKYMSGRYGPNPQPLPGYCDRAGSCAGWGSGRAKDDAHQKWESAVQLLQKGGQILTGLGGEAIKAGVDAQATAAGSRFGLPMEFPTWLLLGGAVVLGFFILRRVV